MTGIADVELRRVCLPLRTPFRTAHGEQRVRDALLVKVTTADAEGWGECAALAEPTYTSEYVDGALHVLRQYLVRGDVPVKGHPMAKAALETAVLDAELRGRGERLVDFLGGVRDRVEAGVAVGIDDDIPSLLDAVEGYVGQGYRRVKLKIRPGWDVEPVQAVRERFGDGLRLQVDANAAYSRDDAEHLARLDAFGLLLIEQPLADDDLLGHADLATRLETPICLDESVTSVRTAEQAIALGACRVVNVKAGRVGGYLEARRVHDACAAAGVPVWCGGMLETGIGRAANVALAALPNFTLPGDLSASDRYFETDLTPPFVLHDGCLVVPDGPGIGVDVLPDVLDAVTTHVEHVRPA